MNDEILKKLVGIAKGDHIFSIEGGSDNNTLSAVLPDDYTIYEGSDEALALKPADGVILAISKLEKGIRDNLGKIENLDSFTEEDKQAIIDAVKQSYADEIEELKKGIEDIKKTLEESGSTPDSPSNPTETPIDRDAVSEIVSELLSEALKDFQPESFDEHEEIASKALFELHTDSVEDDLVTAKAVTDLASKIAALKELQQGDSLHKDDIEQQGIIPYSTKLATSGDVYRYIAGGDTAKQVEDLADKIDFLLQQFTIDFEDPEVERILLSLPQSNGKYITTYDASKFTTITGLQGNTEIISFNELEYFTNLDYAVWAEELANCTNLKSVKFAPNTGKLGKKVRGDQHWNGVFKNCTSLESIDLTGITDIGSFCFLGCSSLKYVTGWENITQIGLRAFNSTALQGEIYAPKLHMIGSMIDTVVGDAVTNPYSLNTLTYSGATLPGVSKVDFPECKAICDCAFQNNTNLTEVNIPKIEYLGLNGTYGGIFDGNSSLVSITMGDNLIQMAPNIFKNCTALPSIHLHNVMTIGSDAFSENMLKLESIYVNDKNHWKDIKFENQLANPLRAAYWGAPHLYEEGAEEIMSEAPDNWVLGYWNTNFTEVKTDDAIATNGYVITTSTPIKITDYESIKVKTGYRIQLFQHSQGKIAAAGNVLTEGEYKVYDLKKSKNWDWPYVIINLYHETWNNAFNTTNKTSISEKLEATSDIIEFTPRNIDYVKELDCTGMTAIGGNQFDSLYDLERITGLEDVTSVGYYSFSGLQNTELEGLDISKITTYNQGSFSYTNVGPTISLNPNINGIYLNTFDNCPNIETVYSPNNVVSAVGNGGAWGSCTNITKFIISDFNEYLSVNTFTNDYSTPHLYARGFWIGSLENSVLMTSYTLPESYTTFPVNALKNDKYITSVDLNKVTTLDASAFRGYDSLQTISGEEITLIKENVFYDCTALQQFNFPNLKAIYNDAFRNCGFTTIDLSNTKIEILTGGNRAGKFTNCPATDAKLPSSLTILGGAFVNCTSLTRVDAKSSRTACLYNVEEISVRESSEGAGRTMIFLNTKINYVYMPKLKVAGRNQYTDSLDKTKKTAATSSWGGFVGKDSTLVDIGKHCTDLGFDALYGNTEIAIIRALTPPTVENIDSWKNTMIVFVPAESLEAYRTANVWKTLIPTRNTGESDDSYESRKRIHAIGGDKWREVFASCADPYDEYADIIMYSPQDYSELVAAYNA